jgi:hypothetical protein
LGELDQQFNPDTEDYQEAFMDVIDDIWDKNVYKKSMGNY